ncbi:MAG: hypothetical protein LBR47_02570 [Spirochaetaceae bacterium]|jgi:uncharacterized integral membrane protein|nr:hypothetical protein [Spirochaetaceae bacterium]
MPWRLILFAVFLVLVIVFIGFNLGNTSDISLGFYTFLNVPVFMTVLLPFAVGMLIMVPFSFGKKKNPGHQRVEKDTTPPAIVHSPSSAEDKNPASHG